MTAVVAPRIGDQEFADRIRRLQARMAELDLDLLLAYGNEAEPAFARYFSDFWPSFESCGVLLAKTGEPLLLIGPESETYARDRSRIPQIRRLSAFRESSNPEYPGTTLPSVEDVIDEVTGGQRPRRFAIAGFNVVQRVTYEAFRRVVGAWGIDPEDGDAIVMELRRIKSPAEIACLRKAADITHRAMDDVLGQVRPGQTELQIRGLACAAMYAHGAENESYPTWVLAGDGGDQAISRARHQVVQNDDFVFVQIGARWEGYASTIGRPAFLGRPDPRIERAVKAGIEGHDRVQELMTAGTPARRIAEEYEAVMSANGHRDWLLYGPAHATGLMEGEPPWIETSSSYDLMEDMTFCIDIFLGDRATHRGFRIEDSIRVGRGTCESLTSYPTDIVRL